MENHAAVSRKRPYRCFSMHNVEDEYRPNVRKNRRHQRKRPPTASIPELVPSQPTMLAPPTFCSKCRVKKFEYEPANFCCANGEVKVATNEIPPELLRLFTSDDEDSLHFQKYCRLYNNLFAFSSLGESQRQRVDELTSIRINKNPSLDQRTYNAPTSDEVAGILLDSTTSSESSGPYIVVRGRGDTSHRIMHYYSCYDPLQYPLLFPHGENGWRPGLKRFRRNSTQSAGNTSNTVATSTTVESLITEESYLADNGLRSKGKDISCREYYCFLFQLRPGNFILETRRLLQQFYVDMYVKLENTRLDFFRNNQGPVRADLYQGIMDSAAIGEECGHNVGHRVILPPSFIGGPRDMRRRYLNAMALVQRFGKPDLFLTMTCNPNWQEIKQELRPGEQAQNRPDLVARIFRAKLMAAKKQLIDKEIFGEVAAHIYVVEFQKRGLPHAHFLVILKPEYKIRYPEDFDRFVSAEIPPASKPYLRKVVLNHMMHGPCGDVNPNCLCMKEVQGKKKCKFSYPKEFSEYTTTNSDGYPSYKRSNTGEVVMIRRYAMDNRWVIPYNPYLLAMFDCHFNVEICSTIQAVKYLYKYVYKGHDKIAFTVTCKEQQNNQDEIESYQSGRWISPPEAAWRIFAFDLYNMHPPVFPLQVHLDNLQTVHFQPDESISGILSDEVRARTPLTEFFRLNNERPDGPQHLYSKFPEHFVWNTHSKTWVDRQKGLMVGRLTFVSPSDTERYHLRLLLVHIPGPKSYNDLLTVEGHLCATFQEAASKRGLIEQDDAIEQCLNEAVEIHMPHALRRLFVTILIFCHPPNPRLLWNKYYSHLSEDFRHAHPDCESKILTCAGQEVERILESMGRTLAEFDLGFLKRTENDAERVVRDIQDVLDTPVPQQYIEARKQLNNEQKIAYKVIVSHVKANKGGMFFIDGPGGTGKKFLYCALYAKVRQLNKIVLPTASSGIAASNLPCGRTSHSRFKLPIDHEASLSCSVPKQGALATLLKQTSVIIWDEAPMANKANVHSLDLLLRDITSTTTPFGGKIVVLGGDFRQVLPVVPHKSQKDAVEASLVSSELWPLFKRFHLHQNMRAIKDPSFASYLLMLGNGKLQQEEAAFVKVPHNIVVEVDDDSDPMQALISTVYPEIQAPPYSMNIFSERAILAPKNEEVDAINNLFIERFEGEIYRYTSYDLLLDDNSAIYPVEFLHTLAPGGMSPHTLILKKECPVILLRNLDPAGGLCNGTRLICKEFHSNLILCEISTGWYKGEHAMIPRVKLRPPSSSDYPFQFQRTQF